MCYNSFYTQFSCSTEEERFFSLKQSHLSKIIPSRIWLCYQKIYEQLVQLREWKFISHCQVPDTLVEAEIKTASEDRLTFKAKFLPSPILTIKFNWTGSSRQLEKLFHILNSND